MNRVRFASVGFGIVFGFVLSWGQLTSPLTILHMLRLEQVYVFLVMASGIAVGFTGIRLLRRSGFRTLLSGEPVSWDTVSVERRHFVGSALFGLGWAVSDACPGPIAAEIGQGFGWVAFTALGLVAGVLIYLRREQPAPQRDLPGFGLASAPD